MKENKVIRLLRLLSTEEMTSLGKFLNSPYFNNAQPIFDLFDQLRKRHPDFKEKHILPEKIWARVFPDKAFSAQKYWWMLFRLRTLIEQFLSVEQVTKNDFENKKQLTKAYSQRNAHDFFEKETKTLVEQIDAQPYQDIHSYSSRMWLKHDYFFHPQTDKYGGAIHSVEDTMDDLDRFYLLAKLRFASEIKNRERIFSKKVPIRLLEESITESGHFVTDNPAYLMYRKVLDLYDPEIAEAAFHALKELFMHQHSQLSRHDQNEVMLNLRNYAIRGLNKGNTGFWKDLLYLYKLGLKLELIIDNDQISEVAFVNIVNASCFEKDFDWAEGFILSYEKYLPSEHRDDTKLLCLSTLYFAKKEFDKALDLIENRVFRNHLHQINARLFSLKIWFEKFLEDNDLFDLLNSMLDANEKFLRRNTKLSEQKKWSFINFNLILRNLCGLIHQKKDTQEINEKILKLLANEQVPSKTWLLEKIKQPYNTKRK